MSAKPYLERECYLCAKMYPFEMGLKGPKVCASCCNSFRIVPRGTRRTLDIDKGIDSMLQRAMVRADFGTLSTYPGSLEYLK